MEVEPRSLNGRIWGDVEERGTRGQRTEGSPLPGRCETGMGVTQDLLPSVTSPPPEQSTDSFLLGVTDIWSVTSRAVALFPHLSHP